MTTEEQIPVAVYIRVSSDDQRDRETIKTQREAIERFLANNPQYRVHDWYEDDGVSGTVPMADRRDGARLVADARAGKFTKIIVFRASRLGRDELDLLSVYRLFVDFLGIELIGIAEPLGDRTMFGFQSIMAGAARRQFLADSARGMDRAAREGRYTGGIVPLGYRVEGKKQTARLVPDEALHWGTWTATEVVRRIYHWLGVERRSCRWIASELNLLGVPTAYARDGRGVRGKETQALWRPGRIRNLVVNPVYMGRLVYGRRRSKNSKRTETIEARVEPLVSPELWQTTQQTLSNNRIAPRNTERIYLLRGVMRCALCGLSYCGSQNDGVSWYRCNGYMTERGGKDHRCPAKAVRFDLIEPAVWRDIESMLREPGALLEILQPEARKTPDDSAEDEAQLVALNLALDDLEPRRKAVLDMYERQRISAHELDERLDRIQDEAAQLRTRIAAVCVPERQEPPVDDDLMELLRQRLDEGLTDEQRSEIVRLLVRQITVNTSVNFDGTKNLSFVIEYRFRQPVCSPDCNGRGSSPPEA